MTKRRSILTPYFLDEHVELLETLADLSWHVNRPSLPTGNSQARMVTLYRPLSDLVAETITKGERPVSIAGDCCPSLGVLAGLQQADLAPTLIWFDAHGDFNTWDTSPSGFLGGMPLAMAVGRGEQTIVDGLGLAPLPEENVILAGARDLDPAEREALQASAVRHLPQVEALLEMDLPPGPLYVHFDCDVLDPQEVPAMKYTAPGGPSTEMLQPVFRRLADTGRVVAVSLSAWDPALDEDGRSRATCMDLLDVLAS